jgi:predicted ATPase
VPGSVLFANRSDVTINRDAVSCDAADFEAFLEQGDGEAAAALWGGDLLPNETDEWIICERDRLARLGKTAAGSKPRRGGARIVRRASVFPYRTDFIGREAELAEVDYKIRSARLVVVEGGAGSGKTRLAVQAIDSLPDTISRNMITLVDIQTTDQLYDKVCKAFRIKRDVSDDAIQALARGATSGGTRIAAGQRDLAGIEAHLRGIPTVLLLDSVEELIPGSLTRCVNELLAVLPDLRLVLTSRRVFRHEWAARIRLSPLEAPRVDQAIEGEDVTALLRNPCLELYQNRAKLVRSTFQINRRNVLDVARLCAALDGVPVAIELAAARVRRFPPKALLEALETSIELLARPGATGPRHGRHSSLEALLRWSWNQLDDAQRKALISLSVFHDGASLETWAEIDGHGSVDAQAKGLVEWCLVQTLLNEKSATLFKLMPLVRQFVTNATTADEVETLRRRHEAYFSQRAGLRAEASDEAGAMDDWELHECELAMRRAMNAGRVSDAGYIAATLDTHWLACGVSPEVLDVLGDLLERAARVPASPPSLFAKIPRLLLSGGRTPDAIHWARFALTRPGIAIGDRASALFACTQIEWLVAGVQPAEEAIAPAEQALSLARSARLPGLEARILLFVGALFLQRSEVDRAQMEFNAAGDAFKAAKDPRGPLLVIPGQTACLMARERFQEAIALAKAGEALARKSGDVATQMQLCDRLAVSYEALGEFALAIEVCRRQVLVAQARGLVYHLAFALWNQCGPLLMTGKPEVALQLLAFSCRYWEQHFGALAPSDREEVARLRHTLQTKLGEDAERFLWQRGWDLRQASAVALASR